MATSKVTLSVDGNVGVITIKNPPVNSLAPDVLMGLKVCFDEAHARDDVKAIVVQGSAGKFSGGFDISHIVKVQEAGDMRSMMRVSVLLMIETIEAGPKPVVASVEGLALGGGLELAMACHARVAAPKTLLGLPELQLGIIPGFGGTQRLPRLVGLQKACEMMLLSKPIKAEEGFSLGLVDQITPATLLLSAAKAWALAIAERRRPWMQSLYRGDKLEGLGEARDIIRFAKTQTRQSAPHLTHPIKCLEAVEAGVERGGYQGNLVEEEYFKQLVQSDVSKSLTHVFFAQRRTSKIPGVTDGGLKPRPIRRVAVIGGGLMGSGIVTALVSAGIPVLLKEVNQEYLQGGLDRIKGGRGWGLGGGGAANFGSRVKKGSMSKEQVEKTVGLVKGTLDYSDFGTLDLVIEAVIESIPLKQKIFSDLERHCSPSCLLSSNTSTIDLNTVGAHTKAQDRIIGAHFFSPAHIMPLLEIVRTDHTSPQALLDLLTLAKAIKKTPVVVGNCTGFAVNRVFFPYTMAACLVTDLGTDPYRIDAVIKEFGMPMGPFRLADLVGMGVAVAVGQQFFNAFPERAYGTQLIPAMLGDQRLGEKNGKGFYLYDAKRKPSPAPDLKHYLEASRKAAGLMQDGKPLVLSSVDILEMVFFPVVNEACRVLDEGIVVRADDLDIASVMAMGFPPHRGGLVFWADLVGAAHICARLTEWAQKYGEFFEPCSYLKERAASGVKLGAPKKAAHSRM